MNDLQRRFEQSGMISRIRALYPYGDHTRNLYAQLLMVRKDLYRLRKAVQSGAKAAVEQIRNLSAGRPVLLIGHSGGGVAAYQAAVMLGQEGIVPDWRIVQIGSPKLPIREEHADKVHYIVSVDGKGFCADYITRLGSWGGISRNRWGVPFWNRMKFAPKHIIPVQTIGGHQHYFRKEEPFVHPERGSNLGLVTDTIWNRVASHLESAASSLF